MSTQQFTMIRTPAMEYGAGVVLTIPAVLAREGWMRVAVVTGGRSVRGRDEWGALLDGLLGAGVEFVEFTVRGEPTPTVVDSIVGQTLDELPRCDAVVAIGGGSVLDAAKAAAAMMGMHRSGVAGDATTCDYLEAVGSRTPTGDCLPVIAVPTTAGTGTEATMNAVISEVGPGGFKKSMRHPGFVPRIALLDPHLALATPPSVTIASGMDAVTQLLESFLSTKANPMTDALAGEGLRLAGIALPRLAAGEDSVELRGMMGLAAYFGGITLANAGLGVVHGIAPALGSAAPVPHGVVCALLVGASVRVTADRVEGADDTSRRVRSRYAHAARTMGLCGAAEEDPACAARLAEWLESLARPLGGLRRYGVDPDAADSLAAASGLKNHPVELGRDEIASMIASVM